MTNRTSVLMRSVISALKHENAMRYNRKLAVRKQREYKPVVGAKGADTRYQFSGVFRIGGGMFRNWR